MFILKANTSHKFSKSSHKVYQGLSLQAVGNYVLITSAGPGLGSVTDEIAVVGVDAEI